MNTNAAEIIKASKHELIDCAKILTRYTEVTVDNVEDIANLVASNRDLPINKTMDAFFQKVSDSAKRTLLVRHLLEECVHRLPVVVPLDLFLEGACFTKNKLFSYFGLGAYKVYVNDACALRMPVPKTCKIQYEVVAPELIMSSSRYAGLVKVGIPREEVVKCLKSDANDGIIPNSMVNLIGFYLKGIDWDPNLLHPVDIEQISNLQGFGSVYLRSNRHDIVAVKGTMEMVHHATDHANKLVVEEFTHRYNVDEHSTKCMDTYGHLTVFGKHKLSNLRTKWLRSALFDYLSSRQASYKVDNYLKYDREDLDTITSDDNPKIISIEDDIKARFLNKNTEVVAESQE